jgi:hypothetical protein
MKQKIYTVIIAIFCLSCVTSCKKYLERDSPTATTDDKFWKLESDLRGNLDGIYGGLPSGALNYSWAVNSWMPLEGLSDNMVFKANYLSEINAAPLGLTTSSSGIYDSYYRVSYSYIRMASRFLEHYSTAYVQDLKIKERYAAESKSLRAFYHLILWLNYGPVPIVTRSLDATEANPPRASQEEIIKFIGSEFLAAIPNLPDIYTENDNYRFSKGTCYALLSILYLNAKDYPKAIQYSKMVIDNKAVYGYDLHQAASAAVNSYSDLFSYNGITSKERVMFRKNANPEAFFRQASRSLSGQAVSSPTASFVNAFETKQGKTIQELGADSLAVYTKEPAYHDNRDPRLGISVLMPNEVFLGKTFNPFDPAASNSDRIGQTFATQTGYMPKKYVDPSDISRPYNGGLGFFIIRYAEMLLTYAEALIENDDYQNPDVLMYINQVRTRAGMPEASASQYNTKEKIRELLRRERRVEFGLEGKRLFDIHRWKIGEEVLNGVVYGAYDPNIDKPYLTETRIFSANKDYLWPIPLAEMNANPNMVQNSGW